MTRGQAAELFGINHIVKSKDYIDAQRIYMRELRAKRRTFERLVRGHRSRKKTRKKRSAQSIQTSPERDRLEDRET